MRAYGGPGKKGRIPTFEDIVRAKGVLSGTIRKTPLQTSRTFSGLAGTNLFLELECLQVTGSFKVRGDFVKISTLSDERAGHGVIASVCRQPCTRGSIRSLHSKISHAKSSCPRMRRRPKLPPTRSYGAKVVRRKVMTTHGLAKEIAKADNTTIVHAFDDPDIIAGQGTIGLES